MQQPQHETSRKETDNNITLSSTSERIRSLDDLLDEFKIDREIWSVTNFIINSYESFRKAIDKDLVFNDGEMSGYIRDEGNVNIVPLFQVKAWLVRRSPVVVEPVLAYMQLDGLTRPTGKFIEHDRLRTALPLLASPIGFALKDIHHSDFRSFLDL